MRGIAALRFSSRLLRSISVFEGRDDPICAKKEYAPNERTPKTQLACELPSMCVQIVLDMSSLLGIILGTTNLHE